MSGICDILIIGGGPAGLSSGIYGARAGYKTVLVEKTGTGGQMLLTDIIDNYPGFDEGVAGFELQERLVKQAEKFGLEIVNGTVAGFNKDNGLFTVSIDDKEFFTKTVIIATGATHRHLGVKGEAEFSSRGVSYCGTCDGPFYRNKRVVVVGGGDSALTEALFIAKFAAKITIVHRKDRFRAVKSLIDKCQADQKIEFVFNKIVEDIKGGATVNQVVLKDTHTGMVSELQTDGVFIFVGLDPNTGFVDKALLDESGYIITDPHMSTNIDGVFAAGDVRSGAFRQVVCGCSDGAIASESAGRYIDALDGNEYR